MPIPAECPAGHTMMVPDHRAGTRLRCPRCGAELLVPGKPVKPPRPSPVLPPSPPPVAKAAEVAHEPAVDVVPPPLPTPPPEPVAPPIAVDPEPPPKPTTSKSPAPGPETTGEVKPLRRLRPLLSPSPSIVLANLTAPPKPPITGKPLPPGRDKQSAAIQLGLLVAALAVFSISPAIWEWYAVWQNPEVVSTPSWIYVVLLAGVIQLAYAVYLAQVPDWSALWSTTAALLAASAGYALMLGTTLAGRDESTLVVLLQYADKVPGNRAAMWCFVMLCFTSVVTYFLGVTAARWHRSYWLLRQVHET